MTTETTETRDWIIPAGTILRDATRGQDVELVTDWAVWEASATIRTATGYTERIHPSYLYRDGVALPYRP